MPHSIAVATMLALPVASLGAVMALDVQEPALEMLMRAVGFSPWGAAMVYIAWQARKDVKAGMTRIADLWEQTLDIVAPWTERARDLSSAIREGREGHAADEPAARRPVAAPARPRRPKTDPVNLPPR